MQKKFLTNLILIIGLNLLIKPFWIFGIDRTVQNVVGSESYGFYFVILNFTYLFNILLDFGISNYNVKNIAQYSHLIKKYFSGILTLKIGLVLLYVLVLFSMAQFIGYSAEQKYLLRWIALNQILLSLILYLRSNISGLMLLRTDSLISVLDRVLMIIICAFLLWGNIMNSEFKIEWFVYAQSIAYFLTFITALSTVLFKTGFVKLRLDKAFLMMLLKQSFPFAVLTLLMSIYMRIDTVMIERLLDGTIANEQAGIYARAFRVFDAGNNFAFLFSVLLLPIFSKMIKQKMEIVKLVRLSFSIIFVGSSILAISSFYFHTEIMKLLYGYSKLEETALIYQILIFGIIAVSGSYIFGTLLTANHNLKQLNRIAFLSVIISITLNLLLIPIYDAKGAAISNLMAHSSSFLLLVYTSRKVFKLSFNSSYLIKIGLFVVLVFLMGEISHLITIDWVFQFGIMILGSIVIAFMLNLLSIKRFVSYLKIEKD